MSATEGPRAYVVTTVRDPGEALRSFLRYHLTLGFAHVLVFFDDPHDQWAQTVPLFGSRATAIPCDSALRSQQRSAMPEIFAEMEPFLTKEVMARQVVNAAFALDIAARSGADWLLHIDIDELFYSETPLREHLRRVPEQVGRITYLNFEAVPESPNCRDYFNSVTLFKKNPRICRSQALSEWQSRISRPEYFLAYDHGKSAVRVGPGARVNGVHSFVPPPLAPGVRTLAEPAILHYPHCTFDGFLQKYHHRGAFSDSYFDRVPRIPFHLSARDAVLGGDIAKARTFFDTRCMFSSFERDSLLEAGLGQRIFGPQTILQTEHSGRAGHL